MSFVFVAGGGGNKTKSGVLNKIVCANKLFNVFLNLPHSTLTHPLPLCVYPGGIQVRGESWCGGSV